MALALDASHPALDDSNLSPAAALAVWMYDTIGPDIVRWRFEVLSEIGDLVDDLVVPDWASTLPSHVTDAYSGTSGFTPARSSGHPSLAGRYLLPWRVRARARAHVRLPSYRADATRHRLALARVP